MTTHRPAWSVLGLALMVALAACTQGETVPEAPAVLPTDDGGEPAAVPALADGLAPLTGLAAPDESSLTRAALSAKIDNHPGARPQVGLESADIVFEELVEGGLTRYVVVWHSTVPNEVGPVRSVRPMDPDIVSPFGGILAYSGGQQRFVEAMMDTPVENAIHGQPDMEDFFYRSSDKVAPHNVIVKAPELIAFFGDLGAPPPQFGYAPTLAESSAVRSGEPVASFVTRFSSFSSPGWTYDEALSRYLRSQTNGAADVALSGDQLSATNVVTLFVGIEVIQDIPTTFLVGSGDGYVASGGSLLPIRWSKDQPEAPIVLTDGSGQRVLLAPGPTWIELLPAEGSGVPAGELLTR